MSEPISIEVGKRYKFCISKERALIVGYGCGGPVLVKDVDIMRYIKKNIDDKCLYFTGIVIDFDYGLKTLHICEVKYL